MPTTTTDYGRQNISWPDLGHDAGALLHSRIVGSVTTLSNQISRYWSGSQALTASGSANLIHNFNLPLSQLRVRIFESNAELSDAGDAGFTLSNISNSTISITNTGLVTRTIEVYIEPRTRMRGEDMDPAIAISTTGNATFNDVIVSGNLTVSGTTTTINSTTLEVADKNILVNNGGTNATAEGSGLDVEGTGNAVVGSLKYEAALASRWKVGANGTEKQIVTVSDTQVITEKDIDGGVASNARRITLPSNTKTNLDALTRKEGTIVYATDDDSIYVDDGTTLNAVGGTSNSIVVTQASHGFVVGDVLYLNGSGYTKAKADSANTSSVAGIVSKIQSSSVFQLTSGGKMSGLTGLTVGADYFLSPVTAGLLTATEPTTTGYVSQPVGIALSATSLQVAIKRGYVVGTSNVFTTITLANTAATTIQNIANFANGEGGVLTGVFRIDATTDYVFGFEISFTKDIAGVINHSVRYFAGDVLPGISVTVSGQNIQVTLGTLAGFVSATARFQMAASAVSPSLQIDVNNISEVVGTWAPTITFGGASVGVVYGAQVGTYQKIGKTVHFRCYLSCSNKGSSTGIFNVNGLPFTSSAGANYAAVAVWTNGVSIANGMVTGYIEVGTASCFMSSTPTSANATGNTRLSNTHVATVFELMLTGSYITN
jgi:hypothetical protein